MTNEPTVETIADAKIWRALAEGVDSVVPDSDREAVFEFSPDRLIVRKKDPASVALIRQVVDATDFEHYDVEDTFAIGVDTEKLEDLLKASDNAETVELRYDWEDYKLKYRAGNVEYDMSGVDADSVRGSPTEVPPIKDEYGYNIDVSLPVELWSQGCDVAELSGRGDGQAHFESPEGERGTLALTGEGDTDASRVNLHEDDGFEWNEDLPSGKVEARMSNKYMPNIVDAISEDYVRFVTGDGNPYHVFTERADGRIETKFMQAPITDTNI